MTRTPDTSRGRTVVINQSYRMQRITGQQRYATEVSRRLRERGGYREIAPTGRWSTSAARVWAWTLLVLPLATRRHRLLSMTARAPIWHPRHVLVVHDLFVLTNPEWFSRRYVLTHAPLLRWQLRTAMAVIAVSEPVADQVRTTFTGPIVVAPNAPSEVFAAVVSAQDDAAVASRGLDKGGYLLAVGSLDPRKNLSTLAAAYGMLSGDERRRLPLVLVGAGSGVFRGESIHWPSGTIHAGFIPDDELRALYRGARAVVFVSLAEGFGLPIVEAAAAGASRMILSDIPVFRWICGNGPTYVDPLNRSEIAGAIRAASTETADLSVDVSRFTWDHTSRAIHDLLHSPIR